MRGGYAPQAEPPYLVRSPKIYPAKGGAIISLSACPETPDIHPSKGRPVTALIAHPGALRIGRYLTGRGTRGRGAADRDANPPHWQTRLE